MIIIEVREDESIDRAVKRYNRKNRRIGQMRELRRRREFVKRSVRRRDEIKKAIYREQHFNS